MAFTETMDHVAQGFEVLGAAVLVVGAIASAVTAFVVWRRTSNGEGAYQTLREMFGGALLLGLEVLVAADLIRTVAVTPTISSVGVLGLIVLIRTFLSFSLEIEIEGVPPWRRAAMGGVSRSATAVAGVRERLSGKPAEPASP